MKNVLKKLFIAVFVLSILLNTLFVYVFVMKSPLMTEGALSWADIYSADKEATLNFLKSTLSLEALPKTTANIDYTVLKPTAGLFPSVGVMPVTSAVPISADNASAEGNISESSSPNSPFLPGSAPYFTVRNYEEAHRKFLAAGATAHIDHITAGGMIFGVYRIPGGADIAICQWQ